mgnify:CR=1 FL=1
MSAKKNVLIFTQCDMLNYGNRLQNIGLSFYLSNNFEVNISNCFPSDIVRRRSKLFYPFKKILFQFKLFFTKPFGKWLNKYLLFKKNTKMFRVERALLLPGNSLKRLSSRYDCFLLGSDQVVNSDFGLPDKIVSFYEAKNILKITYAISSGNDSLNDKNYPLFIKLFPYFDGRSVREMSIIQKHNDISVEKHIDPSFLLTKEEWVSLSEKNATKKIKKYKDKKYVLVYWLGDETLLDRELIKDFAESKNLEIIYLRTNSFQNYKTIIDASPFDFVYLISHSQFVISKSFHGCALSIIFNKPFFGIDKYSDQRITDERYLSLIQTLKIPELCFSGISRETPDFSWNEINECINQERRKAQEYFCNFFRKKEKND